MIAQAELGPHHWWTNWKFWLSVAAAFMAFTASMGLVVTWQARNGAIHDRDAAKEQLASVVDEQRCNREASADTQSAAALVAIDIGEFVAALVAKDIQTVRLVATALKTHSDHYQAAVDAQQAKLKSCKESS